MTNAFVVRTWYERRDSVTSPALWRGMIEEVQSREQGVCKDPADLLTLLAEWIVLYGKNGPIEVAREG